jgi:asparagine synthase (glutamine-hydrolysing)
MIPREGQWSGVEKALLREAFRDGDWLPESILHRQKEQFSDGVGYGWVDALQDRAALHVSDEQMSKAKERFPELTPTNKEMYWMRELFESRFVEGCASGRSALGTIGDGRSVACCTPEAFDWDPSWGTMAGDISGRTMKDVHQQQTEAKRPAAG